MLTNELTRATGLCALVALLTLAGGCSTTRKSAERTAWSKGFSPPTTLHTGRVHLEPLTPKHAELDYAAFMSSREHLRQTLHWGTWPSDDATVEGNRKDLARHSKEFSGRQAYAYTVLQPDRSRCVGCVYMDPVEEDPRAVNLAYWVVQSELPNDLDGHVLRAVLGWIERDWPFYEVVLSLHTDNARGIRIAERIGLHRSGQAKEDHVRLIWKRR